MEPLPHTLFELPDLLEVGRVTVRLVVALALGGILGYEREQAGKAAGLRTHMLVALGACLFVLAPFEAGMTAADLSRVIQGIVAGIGFLGAGSILKLMDSEQVKGLTTAANIWFTAAVGIAVGCGQLWLPMLGTALAWMVLTVLRRLEEKGAQQSPPRA